MQKSPKKSHATIQAIVQTLRDSTKPLTPATWGTQTVNNYDLTFCLFKKHTRFGDKIKKPFVAHKRL
jgi:hypothetical protein